MRLQYHYPKNKFHVAVLVMTLIGAVPFLLLALFFIWGSLQEQKPGFLFAGTGFAVAAICLLWLGFIYFIRTRSFYRSGDWYGIIVNGDRLTSSEFDIFKPKERALQVSEVVKAKETMYRGLRRLQVKTKAGFYSLPVFRLTPPDRTTLYRLLKAEQLPSR